MWLPFAVCSAVFAALTSILAKIGIEGVNSNLATAIRTFVVLAMAWLMVFVTHDSKKELDFFNSVGTRYRRIVALLLPRAADGRRIEGRSRRQDERRNHARSRLCFSARKGFGKIARRCAPPYGGHTRHGAVRAP